MCGKLHNCIIFKRFRLCAMIRMSEGVEVNPELFGSVENKDDIVPVAGEQPPPVGDDTAGEATAPVGNDNAGLGYYLLLCSYVRHHFRRTQLLRFCTRAIHYECVKCDPQQYYSVYIT